MVYRVWGGQRIQIWSQILATTDIYEDIDENGFLGDLYNNIEELLYGAFWPVKTHLTALKMVTCNVFGVKEIKSVFRLDLAVMVMELWPNPVLTHNFDQFWRFFHCYASVNTIWVVKYLYGLASIDL